MIQRLQMLLSNFFSNVEKNIKIPIYWDFESFEGSIIDSTLKSILK